MKPNVLLAAGLIGVSTVASVIAENAASVLINNKTAKLETTTRNGKVFVDGVAFAKALGANARLEGGRLIVSTSSGTPYTQGTTQLAGGVGKLGQAYTMGREKPLNFNLRSAEFVVGRVVIGTSIYYSKPNEKILLLRATVQNPQKEEAHLSSYQFKFTAVDDKNENHQFANYFGKEGAITKVDTYLKPGQKMDVIVPMKVPASGVVPKLIVARDEDKAPVLRYDLSQAVKGVPKPYAAANSAYSAPVKVSAQAGTYYPDEEFDVKLETVAFSKEALNGEAPGEGQRYLVATLSAKNPINDASARYLLGLRNELEFTLTDSGEDVTKAQYEWFKAARPERITDYPNLEYNQEYRFRVAFLIPNDVKPKTVNLVGQIRTFMFDASSAK
jgi:hypothetical protein